MDTSLSPGFARITYTGITGVHHAIIPVNVPSTAVGGVEPELTKKDATTQLAGDAITDFVNLWKAVLSTTQHIGLCEVYKVNPTTGEGTFLWGFDLDTNGSNSGAAEEFRSTVITFKLTNGRIARLTWLDNSYPVDEKVYPPFSAASPEDVFADYLVSGDSIYYGRGNAYPFAPISLTTKTFDPLRTRAGL